MAELPLGNLPLTLATFVGVSVVFRADAGLGAGDGKIAVGLAGIPPPALRAGVIAQALASLYSRLRGSGPARLPSAGGFYLGAVSATPVTVVSKFILSHR